MICAVASIEYYSYLNITWNKWLWQVQHLCEWPIAYLMWWMMSTLHYQHLRRTDLGEARTAPTDSCQLFRNKIEFKRKNKPRDNILTRTAFLKELNPHFHHRLSSEEGILESPSWHSQPGGRVDWHNRFDLFI